MGESGNVGEKELAKLRKDLGLDRPYHEQYFHWLHGANPGKVSFWAGYDDELAHWIEAGADFFLEKPMRLADIVATMVVSVGP